MKRLKHPPHIQFKFDPTQDESDQTHLPSSLGYLSD